MYTIKLFVILSTLFSGWLSWNLQAQQTAFTYQGRLLEGSTPAVGQYAFEFSLFAEESGGEPVGAPVHWEPVEVADGLFTVVLDFGEAPLSSAAPWLEITVRTNETTAPWITLSPRQRITLSPGAVVATLAERAEEADAVAAGAVTGEGVAVGSLEASHFGSGQVVLSLNGLRDDVTLSAGDNAAITTEGSVIRVDSLAWGLGGNEGTDPTTDFLGTVDDAALELRVNNRRALRLEPVTEANGGVVNIIGGHEGNSVREGANAVTIGGGGYYIDGFDYVHYVGSSYGTIGGGTAHRIETNAAYAVICGGFSNRVESLADESIIGGGSRHSIGYYSARAVIGGGYDNVIGSYSYGTTLGGGWSNRANGYYTTVSGGIENYVDGTAPYSAIGGGSQNRVGAGSKTATIPGGGANRIGDDSIRSTIGGGHSNRIGNGSGHSVVGGGFSNVIGDASEAAVIPGGMSNRVAGAYSFAAGQSAEAVHPGAFVWADSSPHLFSSEGPNSFSVRATGGMKVVTGLGEAAEEASSVQLPSGSGAWVTLGDEAMMADVEAADPSAVLETVNSLPVNKWRYGTEPAKVRHLGPSAQAFRAAFGLGGSDRGIATVDADGVALAAIQGLSALVQTQQQEIQELRDRVAALETAVP